MNNKKLALSALLTSLAIIIPFIVVFKVIIPPFTATIGAHMPMFIAMLLGPEVAVMVGLGSALGFFLNLGPIVGARALMHVPVGLIGAKLIKKGMPFWMVALITAPLHGLLEIIVVLPFVQLDAYNLLIVTGVGTVIHHCIDAFVAYIIINVLEKSPAASMLNSAIEEKN